MEEESKEVKDRLEEMQNYLFALFIFLRLFFRSQQDGIFMKDSDFIRYKGDEK